MKSSSIAVLSSLLLVGTVMAQATVEDHPSHHAAGAPASEGRTDELADGEVRKVDKGAGKLTLKHGDIRNLDMPGMTMVFRVRDPALLDKVKAGDRVKFRVEKSPAGLVVTVIDVVK